MKTSLVICLFLVIFVQAVHSFRLRLSRQPRLFRQPRISRLPRLSKSPARHLPSAPKAKSPAVVSANGGRFGKAVGAIGTVIGAGGLTLGVYDLASRDNPQSEDNAYPISQSGLNPDSQKPSIAVKPVVPQIYANPQQQVPVFIPRRKDNLSSGAREVLKANTFVTLGCLFAIAELAL